MKSSNKTPPLLALLVLFMALSAPMPVSAQEVDGSIAACLKAWGDHPFGKNPKFRTLDTSVKVFGIGNNIGDTRPTSSPSLVLINPIVNVLGVSSVDLMNPYGWYCLRTTVSILGWVGIRAHCNAQLAATSDGAAARGNKAENRGIKDLNVTVMGSVSIERPCT